MLIWMFTGLYTDESPGLKVDPVVVLVLSIVFIFSVVALHSTFFSNPISFGQKSPEYSTILISTYQSSQRLPENSPARWACMNLVGSRYDQRFEGQQRTRRRTRNGTEKSHLVHESGLGFGSVDTANWACIR